MSKSSLPQSFTHFMHQLQKGLGLPKAVATITLRQVAITLGFIALLTGSLSVGYLVSNSQDLRQQAASTIKLGNQIKIMGFNCDGNGKCYTASGDWCPNSPDGICTSEIDTPRIDCAPNQEVYGFFCPGQQTGTCRSGQFFQSTAGPSQDFNVPLNRGCGTYQFDFNAPGSPADQGNCGAVIYTVSGSAADCTPTSTTPPGGSSAPTPTPIPVCTLNLRIREINGEEADVKENETVSVMPGDELRFRGVITNKAQGKVSEIKYKAIDLENARPDDFLSPIDNAKCEWDGTTSLDECYRTYTVNPNLKPIADGLDSRVKVEVVAKMYDRNGQLSDVTCTDEIKLKVAEVGGPSPTPTPSRRPTPTPSRRPTPTPTPSRRPTPTPTVQLTCNSTCRTTAQCQAVNPNWTCQLQPNCTGFNCPIGNCRLRSNPNSTTCMGATPTPTPTPTNSPTPTPSTAPYCNIVCREDNQCNSAHICYLPAGSRTGFCRLPSHPTSTVCQPATPTPTPSPTPSNTPSASPSGTPSPSPTPSHTPRASGTNTPSPTASPPSLPQSGGESSTVTAVVATGIVVLIIGAIGLLLLL